MDLNRNTGIKINITQKALEFLQKSQKTEVYIERFDVTDCCVPLSNPPVVRKGRPRKPENFHVYYAKGITVYYDRNLIWKPQITIDIQGTGWLTRLVV